MPSFSEIVLEVYWFHSLLARHGGDLLSYINQVDDRMDNLMEGIKENEVLTKILTAKITNETNKLQERFQKMTALCREQIEKSQYEMKIDKFRLIIENLPNS
jgi:hypothetical protein